MTYPESENVSAGDATLASHYNNLRADSVHLGKDSDDSVALGALLERYESRLEVERLDTTKIRVPASASAPVSLLIDGYLCQAVANVDLDAGEVPAGAAAAYYIFANRTDSSTTFTLTVNTSNTEAANQRLIGRFYWDSSAIVKDSVRSEHAGFVSNLLYFTDPQICNGRLTLSTGVPVPDSDVSGSANVYFTPYLGNRISLYVKDYGWRLYSFSELSLDISGVADEKNIDVWVYDNAGTLTLAYTLWTNDTLRATALIRQDGVLCKTGALEYRYLGTVRTSAAGETSDTLLKRFTWNFYNRIQRTFFKSDTTATWTYNVAAWRAWNNDTDNRVQFVIGVSENPVYLHVIGRLRNAAAIVDGLVGIALDAANANDSSISGYVYNSLGRCESPSAVYNKFPGIGYHYLTLTEYATAGNITFYGFAGTNKMGASGRILA